MVGLRGGQVCHFITVHIEVALVLSTGSSYLPPPLASQDAFPCPFPTCWSCRCRSTTHLTTQLFSDQEQLRSEGLDILQFLPPHHPNHDDRYSFLGNSVRPMPSANQHLLARTIQNLNINLHRRHNHHDNHSRKLRLQQ